MSEEKKENSFKAVTLDDALIRDYLIKILGEGEDFAQDFYQELVEKTEFFRQTLAKDRLPSLKEEELEKVFEKIFSAKRKRKEIIEETGIDKLKKAISDLLYGDQKGGFFKKKTQERTWEEKVDEFAKQLRGIDRKSARDIAAELLHFTFPDEYILWTSWIWDPESETGAIVFLKEEAPTGGRGRRMYGEKYDQFKQVYEQIAEKLQEFGIKVKGYLFVDIFLAMIYATYVDYMTLSTMHSAKGFFPPAGVMAKRLLGVNVPVEFT